MSQWIDQSGLSWTDRDADQWVGGLTWEAESLPLTLSVNEHIGAATTRILPGVLDMQLLLKQVEVEIFQEVFPDSISLSSQLNDPELRISTQISASKQHINAFILPATAREAEIVFPHLIQAVLRLRNPIIFSDVYLEPASMELSLDINEAFYAGDFQIFSLDAPIGNLNTSLIEPWLWVTSNVGVDSISVNLNMQQTSVEYGYIINASALPLTLSLKPSTYDLSFTWVASSLPLSLSLEESIIITKQWFSAALLELDAALNTHIVWHDYRQDVEVLPATVNIIEAEVDVSSEYDAELFELSTSMLEPANIQFAELFELSTSVSEPSFSLGYCIFCETLSASLELKGVSLSIDSAYIPELLELNVDMKEIAYASELLREYEVLKGDITKELILDTKIDIKGHMYA